MLDVPEHSTKENAILIQYMFNGTGNQRWKIENFVNLGNEDNSFTIKNYCSELYLTVYHSKNVLKVTQKLYDYNPEQRWRFIHIIEATYAIQSISNPAFYLSVNSEKGGSEVILSQIMEKSHWIVEGKLPNK